MHWPTLDKRHSTPPPDVCGARRASSAPARRSKKRDAPSSFAVDAVAVEVGAHDNDDDDDDDECVAFDVDATAPRQPKAQRVSSSGARRVVAFDDDDDDDGGGGAAARRGRPSAAVSSGLGRVPVVCPAQLCTDDCELVAVAVDAALCLRACLLLPSTSGPGVDGVGLLAVNILPSASGVDRY